MTMSKFAAISTVLAFAGTCLAQPASLNVLQNPVGWSTGVAADASLNGAVVTGTFVSSGGSQAYRWTQAGGIEFLGFLPNAPVFRSNPTRISRDGGTIIGFASSPNAGGGNRNEAFRWTAELGMVGLGTLAPNTPSAAYGLSADASVIGGQAQQRDEANVLCCSGGFVWNTQGGMVALDSLPGGAPGSWVRDVSPDGLTFVGGNITGGGAGAFRWTLAGGNVFLPAPLPVGSVENRFVPSDAYAASFDASVIVGEALNRGTPTNNGPIGTDWQAFRWTPSTGTTLLGRLPGNFSSRATDVSEDGEIVVGDSFSATFEAFIWDEANGIRRLQDVLVQAGATLPDQLVRLAEPKISPDGSVIVGWALVGPRGFERQRPFIATLPRTDGCDSIDFNADSLFPDDNDLIDFLVVLAGGTCSNDPNCNDIDFNNDGLFPDDTDLIAFLRVLAGGDC